MFNPTLVLLYCAALITKRRKPWLGWRWIFSKKKKKKFTAPFKKYTKSVNALLKVGNCLFDENPQHNCLIHFSILHWPSDFLTAAWHKLCDPVCVLFLFVISHDSSALWLVKLELFLILCWASLKALYHISWHCTWSLNPYCPTLFRFLVFISYPW